MLHRPGDAYSVDVFWTGPDRQFAGWYLNLQDPIRRYPGGFDTLDHELDFWAPASGRWSVKDDELFEQRVAEGRYTQEQAASIRKTGDQVAGMLSTGSRWWDEAWAEWAPLRHGGRSSCPTAGRTAPADLQPGGASSATCRALPR